MNVTACKQRVNFELALKLEVDPAARRPGGSLSVTASAAAAAIVCSESHPGFEPYCLPVTELRWPGGLINDKIAQAGQSPTFFQVFSQIQS